MKTKIKLLTAGLMLCLLLAMPVTYAQSGEGVFGGTDVYSAGDSIVWVIRNSVLSISGKGAVPDNNITDYSNPEFDGWYRLSTQPWVPYRSFVKKIIVHEGITSLGAWALSYFPNLVWVSLPQSLVRVAEEAFRGNVNLSELVLPSGVTYVGANLLVSSGEVNLVMLSPEPPVSSPGYGNDWAYIIFNETPQVRLYVPDVYISRYNSVYGSYKTANSLYDYYYTTEYTPVTVNDTTYIPVTVNDTTHIPVTVNDTTYITVNDTTYITVTANDTVYEKITVNLTDTVWETVTVEKKYVVNFIPVEIQTDIRPYPQETKTPYLKWETALTFRSTSPYSKETLYFYSISGQLIDKVVYSGGGTVQTYRYTYPVIVVSDKGWYQVLQ